MLKGVPSCVIFIILTIYGWCAGASIDTVLLRLDGYNSVVVDMVHPGSAEDPGPVYGSIGQNDFCASSIPSLQIKKSGSEISDTTILVEVSARFGSEIGDRLQNRYLGSSRPNRDHMTIGVCAVHVPRFNTSLFGGYRYIDTYSDRYDSLWAEDHQRNNRKYSETELGLAETECGGFIVRPHNGYARCEIANHSEWGTLPHFFTPVLKQGTSIRTTGAVNKNDHAINADLCIDKCAEYYASVDTSERTDVSGSVGWVYRGFEGTLLSTEYRFDDRRSAESRFVLGWQKTFSIPVTAGLSGAINSRGKPDLSATVVVEPRRGIGLDAGYAFTYGNPQKSGPYYYHDSVLTLSARGFSDQGIHASLRCGDSSGSPLFFRTFFDWTVTPRFDAVSRSLNGISLDKEESGKAARGVGGVAGAFALSVRKWHCNGSLIWRFHAKSRYLPYDLPLVIRAGVERGSRDDREISVGMDLEYRAGTSYCWIDSDAQAMRTMSTNRFAGTTVHLSVPFRSPVFSEHLLPCVEVVAGPVVLGADDRTLEHPLGNRMGPIVAIRVTGMARR